MEQIFLSHKYMETMIKRYKELGGPWRAGTVVPIGLLSLKDSGLS